jgi:chromosome segregation ATPase
MTMVDQKIEKENIDSTQSIETALTALWEKAREASYLISTLRDEKKRLQVRIEELEEELAQGKNALLQKELHIERLTDEKLSGEREEGIALAAEEKRMLQQKIRSAVSKLDQYLSS